MRTFILLMLLAFPVMADSVVAVSSFNGAQYVLFGEKGSCLQGAKASVTVAEKTISACWIQKDGYVFVDINNMVIAVPQVQFTVFEVKTFS